MLFQKNVLKKNLATLPAEQIAEAKAYACVLNRNRIQNLRIAVQAIKTSANMLIIHPPLAVDLQTTRNRHLPADAELLAWVTAPKRGTEGTNERITFQNMTYYN